MAVEALAAYDWPGNVRQLARVLERAVALLSGPEIGLADLPDQVRRNHNVLVPDQDGRDESLRAWSSRYVRIVLDRCQGNKRRACRVLNISYHTLKAHLAYESRLRRRDLRPGREEELAEAYDVAG